MKTFADRLKEIRETNGYTLEDLARILDTTKQVLSRYERGEREPKVTTVDQYAQKLNVNVTWLMGYDVPSAPNVVALNGPNTKSIPIIGEIAAGTPILAVENIIDTLTLPAEYVGCADFGLIVKGDSMSPQIPHGSTVLCRQQEDVNDGEIAAVIIDGEATLKRVKRYNGTVVLRADNPAYKERVLNKNNCDEVRICGKAIRVLAPVL